MAHVPGNRGCAHHDQPSQKIVSPILSAWNVSLFGGRNCRTFRKWQRSVTAYDLTLAPMNTRPIWLRCWQANRRDRCQRSFSWPKNQNAELSDLLKLACDRMPMAAILRVPSGTSRDGTSHLSTGAGRWEPNCLLQLRSGLEIKVASKWLPTPGWTRLTHSVLMKPSGSRSWTAACITGSLCNPGKTEMSEPISAERSRLHRAVDALLNPGRALFSLAVIALGIETLVCARSVGHSRMLIVRWCSGI